MRNDELFSPNCPNNRAVKLVKGYVMRGLVDDRGTYAPGILLARQHAVYEEWLSAVRENTTSFVCGFYEWMCRDCDSAFVFKPGDLVKFKGHYCVVNRRCTYDMNWANRWRLRNGTVVHERWPSLLTKVELKDFAGKVSIVDALHESIEPADIPPEVFALACGKAKSCPMMNGVME